MQRCVAVTSELPGRAVERLEERHSVRLNRGRQLTGEDELIDFVGDADAVLTLLANPITDRVLAACPELRVVETAERPIEQLLADFLAPAEGWQ
jgi:phosphoglycerate dehydrogenase-like enzyme